MYTDFIAFKDNATKYFKDAGWCKGPAKEFKDAKDYKTALKLMLENIRFAYLSKFFLAENLRHIPEVELANAGIALNSNCDTGICLVDEGKFDIGGDAIVFVNRSAHINLSGNAKGYVFDSASMSGSDETRIVCNGAGLIEAKDNCVVINHGFNPINARGKSYIVSLNKKQIVLLEDATLRLINKKK